MKVNLDLIDDAPVHEAGVKDMFAMLWSVGGKPGGKSYVVPTAVLYKKDRGRYGIVDGAYAVAAARLVAKGGGRDHIDAVVYNQLPPRPAVVEPIQVSGYVHHKTGAHMLMKQWKFYGTKEELDLFLQACGWVQDRNDLLFCRVAASLILADDKPAILKALKQYQEKVLDRDAADNAGGQPIAR